MSCNAPPYGANPGKYKELHDAFVNASKSQPTLPPGLMLAQMQVTLETACQAKFLKGDRTMFHQAGLSDETIDSMDVAVLTNAWFASRNAAIAKEESTNASLQPATPPSDDSDAAPAIAPQASQKRIRVVSTSVSAQIEDAAPRSSAPSLPDNLTPVRAVDPQAAAHIAYTCRQAVQGDAQREARCRAQEMHAWQRLVPGHEFPTITQAIIDKCQQPPFPDTFVAREACARYELGEASMPATIP
jgi:hypothetical protein